MQPLLPFLLLAALGVVAWGQEPEELLDDFQLVPPPDTPVSRKGEARRDLKLDVSFDEIKAKRLQEYFGPGRTFSITAFFRCKPGVAGSFTDLAITFEPPQYVAGGGAGEQPRVISWTLPGSYTCNSNNDLRLVVLLALPRKEPFRFSVSLHGTQVPPESLLLSFWYNRCSGFDNTVNPRALMLPLAIPALYGQLSQAREAFVSMNRNRDGVIYKVEPAAKDGGDLVQIQRPAPTPLTAPKVTSDTLVLKALKPSLAEVSLFAYDQGRQTLGPLVGALRLDPRPPVDLARVAVFLIRNSTGVGPANIPDPDTFGPGLSYILNEKLFGLQANFFTLVSGSHTVSVPALAGALNVDGKGMSREQTAIVDEVNRQCAANNWACQGYLHLYYVDEFEVPPGTPNYLALAYPNAGKVFVRRPNNDSVGDLPAPGRVIRRVSAATLDATAHSLGHLFGLSDSGRLWDDLMNPYRDVAGVQCEIRQTDWKTIRWIAPVIGAIVTPRPVFSAGQRIPDLARIMSRLRDSDPFVQSSVIEDLAELGSDEAVRELARLANTNTDWRVEAVPVANGIPPLDAVLHAPLSDLARQALTRIAARPR